jgi:adenine phosphoribosyltransferase
MGFSEESKTEDGNWVLEHLDTIANFPKPGIQFKSIGPLLRHPEAFHKVISSLAERYKDAKIDKIVGLDSRGFIFGTALAYEMKLPFVMVRKAGKLPGDVVKIEYSLEYGTSCFEIERTSISPEENILVIDDVLATGGTASAACSLVETLGGHVHEVVCLIELEGLGGREKVNRPVYSLVSVEP